MACNHLNNQTQIKESANEDVIVGIDLVAGRDTVDKTEDAYGRMLINFLISTNCCMLNGRNGWKNDYTSFNYHEQSVVDYVIVPHE